MFGKSIYGDYECELEDLLQNKSRKRHGLTNNKRYKGICCNLCGKEFKARSRFERFCYECKNENEEYQSFEDYKGCW